jgi:hypothetical protein
MGVGVLLADAFTRNVAGQLVQLQCDPQALLVRHAPITLDLLIQSEVRIHIIVAKQNTRWHDRVPMETLIRGDSARMLPALVEDTIIEVNHCRNAPANGKTVSNSE